jgi:branched-chain amino acid transport system permease protein
MKIIKITGLIALLAVFIAFPLVFSDPAVTIIAVFTILFAVAATGWNIFSGYTGYIALGHAAYFGLGAYAMALMAQDWNIPAGYAPFFLLPLAGLVAAIFAVPFGWIALRTRRHTFVVITIAIFFIMQLMAYNLRGITNGSAGLTLPIPFDWSADFFNLPFYYVALALLLLALGVSWWVRNSKYGLGLLAIRDDEDRALGLGVKTGPSKLVAFVISAFFVGMVGALHVYFIGSLYPPFAFDALFDVAVALMAFLGGLGTLAGPILGALILVPTQQYFTLQFSENGYYLVIYGILFLVIILLLPEGILPTIRKRWIKWMAYRSQSGKIPVVAGTSGPEDSLVAESSGKRDGVNL